MDIVLGPQIFALIDIDGNALLVVLTVTRRLEREIGTAALRSMTGVTCIGCWQRSQFLDRSNAQRIGADVGHHQVFERRIALVERGLDRGPARHVVSGSTWIAAAGRTAGPRASAPWAFGWRRRPSPPRRTAAVRGPHPGWRVRAARAGGATVPRFQARIGPGNGAGEVLRIWRAENITPRRRW